MYKKNHFSFLFLALWLVGCSHVTAKQPNTIPVIIFPGWLADFPIDLENAEFLRGSSGSKGGSIFFKGKNFGWTSAYEDVSQEANNENVTVIDYLKKQAEAAKKIKSHKIITLKKEGLVIYLIDSATNKAIIFTTVEASPYLGDFSVLGEVDIMEIFKSIRRRKQ
ncbi:hypothetical protein [Zooshikella ganghwensis]|uniref:DUF4252 domain-containing protein n=1 Tax=Zooshikella ganghwensis TaxID=202772 RepID=A0A4P9VUF7_9GAMM|nr:hypothetical protein [Zooshikella ganghwensis]RDH46367.1 hypothetical protein B9G39_24555 [Zooshikella ganghwensis]